MIPVIKLAALQEAAKQDMKNQMGVLKTEIESLKVIFLSLSTFGKGWISKHLDCYATVTSFTLHRCNLQDYPNLELLASPDSPFEY